MPLRTAAEVTAKFPPSGIHLPDVNDTCGVQERQAAVQRDTSNQLLEALLATCQKPATSPQLPGFGRELVPYFAAEKQPSVRSKGGSR